MQHESGENKSGSGASTVQAEASNAPPKPLEGFTGFQRLYDTLERLPVWLGRYPLRRLALRINTRLWIDQNGAWLREPATQGQLAALRDEVFGKEGRETAQRWMASHAMAQEAHANALVAMTTSSDLRAQVADLETQMRTRKVQLGVLAALARDGSQDVVAIRARISDLENAAAAAATDIRDLKELLR